jgi:hypothetical protein
MQDQPSQLHRQGDLRVERAIVLQVLRDDHGHHWSRAELEVAISNVDPIEISKALARLDAIHLVCVSGESVWASRAARRLDELELIGI